jgi:flagellar hook-associated protein 1 FlgK
MSLYGILNIGGSALQAQQAALQVTGNNLANAANPNYDVEVVNETASPDVESSSGQLLGSGVSIESVQRQVNLALNNQLNGATSDQAAATTLQNWAGQVQAGFNALSSGSISDQLNNFFNDWSTVANNPSNTGELAVAVTDGQSLTESINTLSSNLSTLSTNIQQSVSAETQQVNQLTSQIADLNGQIVSAQAGGTTQANSLLDQRDGDLNSLSQLVNIQTVAQSNGSTDVYIGSEPLVDGTTAQTLSASTVTNNGHTDSQVTFADGSVANITSGQIGGLFQSQQLVDTTTDSLNSMANNLISTMNNVYSSGQGLQGYTSVTATNAVEDPTQPLTSAASGLDFPVQPGSFTLNQTDATTGLTTSTLISINSGTTLNSLAANLNGISGVQATINNGQLTIQSTNPSQTISFGGSSPGATDTSGVLTALGINTFFTGSNASNIGINSQLASNPSLLAASQGGIGADVNNAQAIANLNTAPQSSLNGASISDVYNNLILNVGSAASNATNEATTTTTVQQSLQAQQQSLSGVSTDQEAINMILEQRSYQGAAEFISTINTMMQSLLAIT